MVTGLPEEPLELPPLEEPPLEGEPCDALLERDRTGAVDTCEPLPDDAPPLPDAEPLPEYEPLLWCPLERVLTGALAWTTPLDA